ncbi:cyclic nucleotide-binding domain-containing protein [Streptomyces nodosus]|uniref:Cyclic nucleotide-binding domain-containing protein n=1 Tax=Streptomyces nodosus TaxID=40318 RepID=A0A0B5D7Z8_9ACTN|nr:cyclic nucleotide-binding domain-containing protein [Streptomyces nodosus]AJE39334.1 regulator [Streptomyces nodosus]MBB4790241.1 CRP-like cAMP-binding protein [Streptomyces nodosus]QEV37919.1 cyclic nucleotide-binding domain-containing protein [Streptomyces nodosus]
MNAPPTTSMLRALPAEYRERLMRTPREVSFRPGTRLFEEGGRAERFWIVRSGTVDLDLRVPGGRAIVETLGPDELIGWSWLFTPHVWHLGAEATTAVRAHEFDAAAVRSMCRDDPALGLTVAQWVGGILTHRLCSARTRLLDLYAPRDGGGSLR